jgi:hypothetical protein
LRVIVASNTAASPNSSQTDAVIGFFAGRADGLLLGHAGTRSVATAHMPDHDLVAMPFIKRYFTTGPASIVAPIVTLPIVSVLVETVRSDAEAHDFGFGRDSIPGGCRENPHSTRDGGDKR